MSEDLQFRETVISSLVRNGEKIDGLCEKVDGTNEHLKKLNGSVSNLYKRDEENLEALRFHETHCPVLETVQEVKTKLETGDHPGSKSVSDTLIQFNAAQQKAAALEEGRRQGSRKWSRVVIPFAVVGVGELIHLGLQFVEKWLTK